jgi:hypothetical protein
VCSIRGDMGEITDRTVADSGEKLGEEKAVNCCGEEFREEKAVEQAVECCREHQ